MHVFTTLVRRSMFAAVAFLFLYFLYTANSLHADTATQTDWSWGPGVAGPVTDWSTMFDSSLDIKWLAVPGQLTLSSTPLYNPRQHLIEGSFDGARVVCTADVDGDGDIDVLGAALNDGIAWWEKDYLWYEHTIDENFAGNFMSAVDMDGDEDIDVVVAGCDLETDRECIMWWENQNDSISNWVRHRIDADSCPYISMDVGDMDGDGDIDVLAALPFG